MIISMGSVNSVILAQLGERRGTLIFPCKTMGKFKLWGDTSHFETPDRLHD